MAIGAAKPAMNCDPQALISASREFCCIPNGMQRAVIISLLCDWANNITPPPTVLIHWTPETENVAWTDGGGLQVGNYAAFVAGVDAATLTQLDFTGSAINTLTGLNSVASLTNVIVTGNALVGIDVTGCTSLLILSAANNAALTSITGLTTCTNLQQLLLDGSDINGTLNVSGLANLTNLVCSSNFNLTGLTLTGCTSLNNVNCDNCNITGTLDVSPAGASLVTLTCVNNGSLTTLTLTGCAGLVTLDCSFCGSLATLTDIVDCVSLSTLFAPNSGITAVTLGGAANMTTIDLVFNPTTSLVAASLVTTTSDILLDSTSLTTITLPNLVSVGSQFALTFTPMGPTLSLPAVTSIGVLGPQGIDLQGNTSLVTFSAPNLVTVQTGIIGGGNTSLANVDLSAYLPTPGTAVSFFNCALNTTSVDLMLARCVASATWGLAGETLDLSGGTNLSHALWSLAALADEITLSGRGAIVLSNP